MTNTPGASRPGRSVQAPSAMDPSETDALAPPRWRRTRRIGLAASVLLLAGAFPTLAPAGAQQIPPDGPLQVSEDLRLVETVAVDVRNPSGTDTIQALQPGTTYVFETSGSIQWGVGAADAECATFDVDATYLPDRFSAIHTDLLDILVNGAGVSWQPDSPDLNGCDPDHVYRLWHKPTTLDRVNFRFHENPGYYPDNTGVITVKVYAAQGVPPDGTLLEQFSVPSNSPAGTSSATSLVPTKRYRLVVSGQYLIQNSPPIRHDAECVQVVAGILLENEISTPWTRQDQLDDRGEMKDVYVNGAEVDWVSTRGQTGCDDRDHTYMFEFSPNAGGPVNLAIRDLYYPDNQGSVTAKLYEIAPPPPSSGGGEPGSVTLVEEVKVAANNPAGANTLRPLVPGQTYIFEAEGTVKWGLGEADPECATFDVDRTWLPDRFSAIHPHLLDVLVNGQGVEWNPTEPDVNGCNTDNHIYRHWFRATGPESVNFRFHESPGYYPDNRGEFTVRVFSAEGVPPDGTLVDEFTVPANSPAGATSSVSLTAGRRYRIAAAGLYKVQSGPDLLHDAECVQAGAGPYTRQDQLDEAGEMKDVYVGGNEVDWVPSAGNTGCDEKFHTYLYELTPEATGRLNFAVRDLYYPDNQGGAKISIFEVGPPPPGSLVETLGSTLANPPAPSALTLVEEVRVDSRSKTGATTVQPLIEGERYIFEAVGKYSWGLGNADAECATFNNDATFLPGRFTAVHPHILDVLVDNTGADWEPTRANPDGCNTSDHTYRVWHEAADTKRVNFRINEDQGYYGDNEGSLTVKVFLAEGVPPDGTLIDEFTFLASSQAGGTSAVTLQPGRTYRLAVAGVYRTPDVIHDAECVSVAGGPFSRQDQLDDAGQMKDVVVNGAEVDWAPSAGRTGCDEKFHTYLYELTPAAPTTVNLKVFDFYYPDNAGELSVQVYEL